ncbi:iron ABC transporter permease [Terrihabitans rhizophilus]|uniref:Iron ABC transporter permease n=1 Tax=Terrihabitans rhizophilus TaxID=3092662 RepID=A0ABU4RLY2_9HYPH|nr:iron ABC transporter permease [Terrihabitans sp. PJ23]MDX6805817.1 iron ABC transporter permease [Terrihabitans sp. PJ23]
MHPRLLIPLLAVLMVALIATSAVVGSHHLDIGSAIASRLAGRQTVESVVFFELRLPRAALAAMVGFSLGISGAAMQGWLRNPLADPGVIGVSATAALGAVIAFYSGLAAIFSLALPLGGIGGAMVSTLALYLLAGRGAGTTALVLAGVALASLAAALTALALNLSPNPYATVEIMFWLMGGVTDRSADHVLLAFPLMALGWLLLSRCGPPLDALTLGEDTARSLGFDLHQLRAQVIAGVALAVGSAVAVSGAIGFIGLIMPHLLRPILGNSAGRLLVPSGLGGAVLLLAADIFIRLIPVQPELKLGVVTALLGAPFLFALVWRLRSEP